MDGNMKRLYVMVILTSLFFIAELVVGLMTNTLSLVADSFHMLSDAMSMVVGIVALRISKRAHTPQMTYGWKRAQTVGGLVNGVTLLTLCFTIAVDAIERFVEPKVITNPVVSLSVACAGLAINLFGMALFGGHAHMGHDHDHDHDHGHESDHKHKHEHGEEDEQSVHSDSEIEMEIKDIHENHDHLEEEECNMDSESLVAVKQKSFAMHSVFLHILGDTLGSLAVIASVLFSWLTKFSWKGYVDPAISLLVAAILVFSSIPLVRRTIAIVMQKIPRKIDVIKIGEMIKRIPGVISIHELHVWQLDELRSISSVHVLVKEDSIPNEIVLKIKAILHRKGVHSTTVQPEVVSGEDHISSCILKCEGEACNELQCCDEVIVESEPLIKQRK